MLSRLGQDELRRYGCGKLCAAPYTASHGGVTQTGRGNSTQPNSVLLFICSIVFVALRPLSVGPLEINVNGICLSISENKYKIKASLKQIAQ